MNRRIPLQLLTLLMALSLACAFGGGGGGKKNPPSASKDAADLQITRQEDVSGARPLSISPDGKLYLAEGDDELCYGDASTFKQTGCVAFRTRIDATGIAWSPDSTQVAFTENAVQYLFESDLWVLNLDTGELDNRTDDGYAGGLLKLARTVEEKGGELPVDTSPAWSPDGKSILFVRSYLTDPKSTSIDKIPAGGGKPVKLLTVAHETPFAVFRCPLWTGVGKKIVYTVNIPGGDRDNGIWIAGKDGSNPRQLLDESDPLGIPVLTDVSATGDKALVQYPKMIASAKPGQNFIFILDLKTGDTTPLKADTGDRSQSTSPIDAVFSPDGSKILYFYRSLEGPNAVLAVRPVDGAAEQVLINPDQMLYFKMSMNTHALYWTSQDTLFVQTQPDGGYWFTLGSK